MLSSLGYAISRRFHQALEPLELEPGEFALLRAVAANEGESQNALAERLHISPSWMVSIVDELERRELLQRTPHARDRRVRNLHLTTAGKKLLRQAERHAQRFDRPGDRDRSTRLSSSSCSTCSTESPPASSSNPEPTPLSASAA